MPVINKLKLLLAVSGCCLFSQNGLSQVIPGENDTLNYRIVGFSVPAGEKAGSYVFEIAAGYHTDEKTFRKHILLTRKSQENRLIEEVPAFGETYTWRVLQKGKKQKAPLYHFHTGKTEYADTSKYRLRIVNNTGAYNNMLVLPDYSPVMYNMNGRLVWYIPDIPGVITKGEGLRDLKPTGDGTFTVLNNYGAFEFNYKGKIVWQAPNDGAISGDSVEFYHHEFTKLPNGHYMVSGYQKIERRIPDHTDTTNFMNDKMIVRKNGILYKIIDCPTVIEYDSSKKIVWCWKSSEYFTDTDYFSNKAPDGTFISAPHLNSFCLDAKGQYMYLGFRNLNRILKIDHNTKQVVAQYGQTAADKSGPLLFRAQHCVKVDGQNDIYMFNNNGDREQRVPSTIVKFRQPENSNDNLTKIWEFPCEIDQNAPAQALAGGSVYMLPDQSILACMGMAGRIFIVTPGKKVLWNAIPETKTENGDWIIQQQYRASIILDKDQLNKFLFN